ncbi:MAG: acyl-CoA thioesterase [Verrucomicrobiae bacterium]|nr:acyl-CoA thioesterase [Verrucomicrobiae bacterium]
MDLNSLPETPELTISVRAYYYDTDAGGVVHNIAYLRWIEEARTRLAEHLGWSLETMAQGEEVPVVARTEIDYLRPARLGDTLQIHSQLIQLKRASFQIAFTLTRLPEQTLMTRCQQTLATIQLKTGRPCASPEAWRKRWPHLILKKGLKN